MPIRSPGAAPYAPPAAVMEVINGYRERGLTTPFTGEVLVRAGVSESLVPRTLKSLEVLELIDKDGKPTPQFDLLRRATSEEFKPRLAEFVRGVYSEVFQFTDPAKDTSERIADAFRAYDPIGQRGRMVTLFMGLCAASGIIPDGDKKSRPTPAKRVAVVSGSVIRGGKRQASFAGPVGTRVSGGEIVAQNGAIPPAIIGILATLPPNGGGWTMQQREKFMAVFGHVLDFTVPIVEPDDDDSDDQ